MPICLLIALFLAFGSEALSADRAPVPVDERWDRLVETFGAVGVVGLTSLAMSWLVLMRIGRSQSGADPDQFRARTPKLRRLYLVVARLVDLMVLAAYAWIIDVVGWAEVVRSGFGLANAIVVDEALILAPYLVAQVVAWWALYPAERALRSQSLASVLLRPGGAGRFLFLKVRQTLGLVLPFAVVFALGQDLSRTFFPEASNTPEMQMALVGGMGLVVLVLSPGIFRFAWQTRPLEAGPLRERLERVSKRFGFRCSEILVWDTGYTQVNAGVTGVLPFFRYVLLTDALVENLDPQQVVAVFGHEVGHVRHRHMLSFGVFFLGSLSVMALVVAGINQTLGVGILKGLPLQASEGIQVALSLGILGAYFLTIFGALSRRFERQADLFGCHAVSCDSPDCSPHPDLYDGETQDVPDGPICPTGVQIFTSALLNVEAMNGGDASRPRRRWAFWRDMQHWRHGTVAQRIGFLRGVEGRPDVEATFQRRLVALRITLLLALLAATFLAFATDSIKHFAM